MMLHIKLHPSRRLENRRAGGFYHPPSGSHSHNIGEIFIGASCLIVMLFLMFVLNTVSGMGNGVLMDLLIGISGYGGYVLIDKNLEV